MAALTKTAAPSDRLRIDLLFPDLEGCARCRRGELLGATLYQLPPGQRVLALSRPLRQ
jgi:hypothetical protein